MPDAVAEKKANAKLSMARRYKKEGKPHLAAKEYQEILEEFPDTEAAQIAQGKGIQVVDKRADKAQEDFPHG